MNETILNNGYVVIPGFYEKSQINELYSFLGEIVQADSKVKNLHLSKIELLKATLNDNLSFILKEILKDDYYCIQLAFDPKPPDNKGHILHTDDYFVENLNGSLLGVYIALEESNSTNGGLYFTNNHSTAFMNSYMIGNENGYEGCLDSRDGNYCKYKDSLIPIELKKGDVVIWLGNTIHGSDKNKSEKKRRSLLLHVVSKSTVHVNKNYLPFVDKYGTWVMK